MHPSGDSGQTAAEYAVVLALITLAVVLSVASLSGLIVGWFNATAAAF
jgi:Flp pilus assembly pilin Flp